MEEKAMETKSEVEGELAGLTAARLRELGMEEAAKRVESAEKMRFAYAEYLFVTQEAIAKFNEKLFGDSYERDGRIIQYKKLVFIPLAQYTEVPPARVLADLENAKADKCFDTFEVAKIDWIRQVEDPILFGRINGCDDLFFISQWDDDVKIEDILFLQTKEEPKGK
jgi:hypothetical protein